MKITSAEANKILKKLNAERDKILSKEQKSSTFLAAMGESADSVRPKYDYERTRDALHEVEQQIRQLKHAINVFNVTTVVEGTDMTIDQLLVYIPQLTATANKLQAMASRLPREREEYGYRAPTNIVDYRYTNYDTELVETDYNRVADQLASVQNALDKANSTLEIEVNL